MDIGLCKKEFFLIRFDGVKIVKSENGGLCGVGRIPHRLRTL